MSQPSQQTTIDQFYRVISNKNTGCGILNSLKNTQKQPVNHSIRRKKSSHLKKNSKKYSLVESEVEIIAMKTPTKKPSLKTNSPLKLDSHRSPKKSKFDNDNTNENNGIPDNGLFTQLSSVPINRSSTSPKTPSRPNKFSPKVTPQKSSPLKDNKQFSPRKLFFADRINVENVQQAVENLNLRRQGSIGCNEFDLESIFKSQDFSFIYSDNITQNADKFEMKDITYPKEKHADHLLMIIADVFSNPVNCGYFTKNELDQVFSMFTLSPEAQMLFVRLLKRKLSWHRSSLLKYPEIADNLDPFCKELALKGFCIIDMESTDMLVLLDMLQADEVKTLCKMLKIKHLGNKPVLIERLLEYGSSSKSFFVGAKTPNSILRSKVLKILQSCVCLPQDIIDLFDRVLTLLHPIQDPTENIADLFLTLTNVHKGDVLYPSVLKKEFFPIFKNRAHLIGFTESKNALREILACIERKEWNKVKELGRLALERISKKDDSQLALSVPLHIKKFIPEYTWLKVLSKSVDAFKKTPETIPEAVNILQVLINNKKISQSSCGRWYNELALIEMHHKKDLEASAALTLHALKQNTLSEVDISGLIDRLKKLMRRKNGISAETKSEIKKVQEEFESRGLVPLDTGTKTIVAVMANRAESTGKSKWSININGDEKSYGSVEMVALTHYTTEENFREGLHCEGSLPVTLFAVCFWEELYNIFVPGAFVTQYQDAPLDLFTADFFHNRQAALEQKIKYFRGLDLESFSDMMGERFLDYNKYQSVMSNILFKNEKQFKDVVTCLGVEGVVGICEKLASNYVLWRSGFPDLIVWNILCQKSKIIEVKGPGDSLSEKQKLWLQYLGQIGIDVEVCHVEASARGSK